MPTKNKKRYEFAVTEDHRLLKIEGNQKEEITLIDGITYGLDINDLEAIAINRSTKKEIPESDRIKRFIRPKQKKHKRTKPI